MDLKMYAGLDEVVLREKLTRCKDISERCRIRAALRRMSNTNIDVAASKAKIRRERRNVEPLEDRVNKLMEEEAKEREKKLEKLDEKIKGITDEDVLRSMLKDTEDYYERKRIRTAVRELRRTKDAEIEVYRPTRRASRQHQQDLLENSLNDANVSDESRTNHVNNKTDTHIDKSDQITDKNRMTGTDMIDACQSLTDINRSGDPNKDIDNLKKEVLCEEGFTSNMSNGEDLQADRGLRLGTNGKVSIDEQDNVNTGLVIIDQEPIEESNKPVNDHSTGHHRVCISDIASMTSSDHDIPVQLASDESLAVVVDYSGDTFVLTEHEEHLLSGVEDTQVLPSTLPVLAANDNVEETPTDRQTENKMSDIQNLHKVDEVKMNKELRNEKMQKEDEFEDVFCIQDENILRLKLRETDDFEKKRQIRAAMRELRRKSRENSQNEEEQINKTNNSESSSNDAVLSTDQDLEVESCDQELTTIQIAFEVPETGQLDGVNSQDDQDVESTPRAPDVEDIADIDQLQALLDNCEDLEERRRIRTALRLLRKRLREQESIQAQRDEDIAMVTPCVCQNEKTADGEQIMDSEEIELDEKIEGCQTIQIEFEVPQGGGGNEDEVDVEERTVVYPAQFAAFEKAIEGMSSFLQEGLKTKIIESESHSDDCDENNDSEEEDKEEEEAEEEDEADLEEEAMEEKEEAAEEAEDVQQETTVKDVLLPAVDEMQFAVVQPIVKANKQEVLFSDMSDRLNALPLGYKDTLVLTDLDDIKQHNIEQSEIVVESCTDCLSDVEMTEDAIVEPIDVRADEASPGETADDGLVPVDSGGQEDAVELGESTCVEIAVHSSKNNLLLPDDTIDSSVISLDFERIDDNLDSIPVDYPVSDDQKTSDIAMETIVNTPSGRDNQTGAMDKENTYSTENVLQTGAVDGSSCNSSNKEAPLTSGSSKNGSDHQEPQLTSRSSRNGSDHQEPQLTSRSSRNGSDHQEPQLTSRSSRNGSDHQEPQLTSRSSRNGSDHQEPDVSNTTETITEPKRKMLSKTTLFLNDVKPPVVDQDSIGSSRSSSVVGSRASTPTSTPQSSRSGSICSPNNKVSSMRNKFQFGCLATTTPHKSQSKRDAKIIKGMAGKVSGAAAMFNSEVSTPKKSYSPLVIKSDNKISRFIQAKNEANSPSTIVSKNRNESSSKAITGLVLSSTPKSRNVLERYQPVQSSIKKDTKQIKTETESSINKTDRVDKMEELQTPNTKRKSQLKIKLNNDNQVWPNKSIALESPISATEERTSYLEPVRKDALKKKLSLGMDTTNTILSLSNTDQNGNPMDISLELDITELQTTKLISKNETDKDICDNGNNSDTCMMAPDIEQMEDVTELEKMLEVETVFEERKRIRARLRELRKKTKDVTEQPTTDREKRRRERREATTNNSQRTSTDDRNNNINEKESTSPKKTLTKITTPPTTPVDNKPAPKSPTTPVNNKPALTTPTTPIDNKPALTTPTTPVDNKPPLSPNNNSTAITKEKPEAKTTQVDKVEEKSEVTDDGKTKTTTNIKKVEKDGTQSVTKSTVSKSSDGKTKHQTETTEEVVRHDGPCGFSYAKKSTTVSSSSSSSNVPESQPLTSRKMSKFDEELARKKKEREEKRTEDAIKWKEQQAVRNKRLQEQRRADQAAAKNKKANIMQMFGGKVESGSGSSGPPRMMVQNANSIKAKLLEWCKRSTIEYPNVKIENFSRSWNNGMAFCAIIHHYYPGAFNFDELNPKARRHNFDLAFTTAENLANIMPLLDTEDMIMMKDTPDWKCVFTYVQSLYRNLNGKPISPV